MLSARIKAKIDLQIAKAISLGGPAFSVASPPSEVEISNKTGKAYIISAEVRARMGEAQKRRFQRARARN